MHQLKTIDSLKSYHKNIIIIRSLNIFSLKLHFQDIFNDPNLVASHILCLN
jgi:hypothetical protein